MTLGTTRQYQAQATPAATAPGTKSDLSQVNGPGGKTLNGGVAGLQHDTVSWRMGIKDWQGNMFP